MSKNSLRGISRLPRNDPRMRRNANRLSGIAGSVVSGVLSLDNEGRITLGITDGTGLIEENGNLKIDFATDPGLEVIDLSTDTGLRVKVDDGIQRTADGIGVRFTDTAALEFYNTATTGYRWFRITVTENNGDGDYTSSQEWNLRLSSGGADQLTDTSRLTVSDEPFSAEPGSELVDTIYGDSVEGNGWTVTVNQLPAVATYEFDAGTQLSPTHYIVGGPIYDNGEPERAWKAWKLEGSNDGMNWVELDSRSDETGWSYGEVREYEISSSTPSTQGVRVQLRDGQGINHVSGQGLGLDLGTGLTFGTEQVNGVSGHWYLDDGSGTTAEDSTANDNDASLNGSPTWNASGGPAGIQSTYLEFDGSDDIGVIGTPSALDFDPQSNEMTLMGWVRIANGDSGYIIAKRDGGDFQCGLGISLGRAFGSFGNDVDVTTFPSEPDVDNDEWHHLACVNRDYDGTMRQEVWVDGELIDVRDSGTETTNGDWLIGGRGDGSGGFTFLLTGDLADVRVYKGTALDAVTINSIAAGTENDTVTPIQVADNYVKNTGDTVDGTLTADGFKLASVTLAGPTAGLIEFDGDSYVTATAHDARTINLADGIITSDSSVSNTTTETTVYTESISANELHAGQLVRCHVLGRYSTANSSDTFTARLKIGGTTVASVSSTAKSTTDGGFDLEFMFTVRTTGATGTVIHHAKATFDNDTKTDVATSTTTIDTTAADDITITIEWSAADASNSVTIQQGWCEFLN